MITHKSKYNGTTTSERKPLATYLPKNENGASYPQDHTVLLVIDPVNDFLSEGGAAWELTKKTLKMNNVIENLQPVTAGARAKKRNKCNYQCAKIIVDKMPWTEPPTNTTLKEKQGQPAA